MRQLYRESLPGKNHPLKSEKNLFLGTVAGLYRMETTDLQNKTSIFGKAHYRAGKPVRREFCGRGGKKPYTGFICSIKAERNLWFRKRLKTSKLPVLELSPPRSNGWAAIATHGSGVIFYQPVTGEILPAHADNGLPDNPLVRYHDFLKNGQLWIASSAGLTLISLIEQLQLERQLEMLSPPVSQYSQAGELFGAQIGRILPRADDVILAGNNLAW